MNRFGHWRCRALAACALAACALVACESFFAAEAAAQEPQSDAPANSEVPVNKELIDAALALTSEGAAKYAFKVEGADEAKLRAEPVLRWSNPSVGEIHGNVFLWTIGERPAVVGSLFKWFTPHTHMSHEFHSLAEAPLVGKLGDRQVWTTSQAGVKFAPLPDAPQPAASAAGRLLQMRRLAKDFAATKTERDGNRQELRLLTQPIYRYAAPDERVLDGALFVLVQGTDPEVFLLLEARGPQGSEAWHFAPARMNSVGFQLRYRDKEIWRVEVMPWADIGSHASTYTTFRFEMP